MPRAYFSNIFSESPFTTMQEHMRIVDDCVQLLDPFFDAVLQQDLSSAREIHKRIGQLENRADSLKKKLRLHMPKGLFMPVARRDLLELLLVQDKAANKVKDISGLVIGRKMQFPDSLATQLPNYIGRAEDACRQAMKVIDQLDELVVTGFAGREIEVVAAIINQLDIIEKDTDKMQIEIRRNLRKLEQDLPPIDVMFYYRVIENIGEVGDISQRIGSRVELLLAR